MTSPLKRVSEPNELHKHALSTVSTKTHFHSRNCQTSLDCVTGNPVADTVVTDKMKR